MPPANVKPMTLSSMRIELARITRSVTAAASPQKITLRRSCYRHARGGERDDDGVVARHGDVDQDDLEKRDGAAMGVVEQGASF